MQLPLDFQKFFIENIQKIKNGLRPLISLKFLPEYSENQKWATPLIRLLSQTPSPEGKA